MAVNALRYIREAQHKSRKDVALAIGKSELTVWRYEEGKSDIPAFALKNLATFLGVSVADLLVTHDTNHTLVGVEGE